MGMMVSPYALAAAGGGGGANGYFTAEHLASQNVVNTAVVDLVTLTVTAAQQVANAKYLVLWMGEAQSTNNAQTHQVSLYQDGVSKQVSISASFEATSPPDILGHGSAFVFTAAATPVDVVLLLKATNSGSVTTAWTNCRIVAVKLGTDDIVTTATARQTATNTLTTAATLSFTPPSSGDYLIIAGMICDSLDGSAGVVVQLSDGTTSTTAQGTRVGGGKQPSMLGLLPLTGISGSKSVTLQFRNSSVTGGTAGIQNVVMVALRLSRFANNHITRLGSTSTGTETSYTTALSQTFTPPASDHLILSSGLFLMSTSTVTAYARVVDGATAVNAINTTTNFSSTTAAFPFMGVAIAAYAASSRTQSVDRKAEANSASILVDAVIASIDLTGI